MIKSILPTNIAKTGFIGTALLGMACAGAVAQNKPTTAVLAHQPAEIMSKEASSALKTQVLSNTVRILPDGNIAEYNSAGKIVRECLYDNDSLYRYYTYKYNDDGTLNLNAAYSADGDCVWARAYYYNQDGVMSDLTICDDTISIRYFDKDGYITEIVVKDKDGNNVLKYVYNSDESGNRTEKIYDAEGKLISADSNESKQ